MTILHLTSDNRENVLIIDDSMYRRTYSKKTELMCKCYDHCKHAYDFGFRLLTLGWSDGNTFLPVNFCLMSSSDTDKRINESNTDLRSNAGKQRKRAMSKTTEAMLELLKDAKKAAIPAKYLLCDIWFTFPSVIASVKEIGYDVIGMVRKSSKFKFLYCGIKHDVMELYKQNRKRRGKSKYLLCVDAAIKNAGREIPVRFVYVRNRSNRKDYRVLISTDISLSPEEIIRIYGKRWDIEVFFKICKKSYLRLERECRSISYDTLTAHVAIVVSRYMLLAVRHREENDLRSIGVLFQICVEELSDLQYAEALQRIFKEFATILSKELDVDEQLISNLLETFLGTLPAEWQTRLTKCAA